MTIRLLSAASVIALVAACSDQASAPSGPAAAAVQQGQNAFLLGDYGAAEQSYRAALSADPGNAAALLGLAEVLEQTGRTPEALDFYRRAQSSGSGDIRVWEFLTESNLRRPQDGVTETAYRRLGALSHGSGHQVGHYPDVMEQDFVDPAPAAYAPAPVETAPYDSYGVTPGYTLDSGSVYQPDPAMVGTPIYDPSPISYTTEPVGYQTAPIAYETVPATPIHQDTMSYGEPAPHAPAYSPLPPTVPAYRSQPTTVIYQDQQYYPAPSEPAPYAPYDAQPALPAPTQYYEYDPEALSKPVAPLGENAIFATPVPRPAPAAMGLPSGYTLINGVVEYVGEGQTAPASAGGLQPANTTTTYETMPAGYGDPVEVVPSGTPINTPDNYSAPRGVDVQGGYEYIVDEDGLIKIK